MLAVSSTSCAACAYKKADSISSRHSISGKTARRDRREDLDLQSRYAASQIMIAAVTELNTARIRAETSHDACKAIEQHDILPSFLISRFLVAQYRGRPFLCGQCHAALANQMFPSLACLTYFDG